MMSTATTYLASMQADILYRMVAMLSLIMDVSPLYAMYHILHTGIGLEIMNGSGYLFTTGVSTETMTTNALNAAVDELARNDPDDRFKKITHKDILDAYGKIGLPSGIEKSGRTISDLELMGRTTDEIQKLIPKELYDSVMDDMQSHGNCGVMTCCKVCIEKMADFWMEEHEDDQVFAVEELVIATAATDYTSAFAGIDPKNVISITGLPSDGDSGVPRTYNIVAKRPGSETVILAVVGFDSIDTQNRRLMGFRTISSQGFPAKQFM